MWILCRCLEYKTRKDEKIGREYAFFRLLLQPRLNLLQNERCDKEILISLRSLERCGYTLLTEGLLIAIVMLMLGVLLDRLLPIVLEDIGSKIQKRRWKTYVLKEYPNRDLIVKLKLDSEIEVLGKKYKVGGFVVLDDMEIWVTNSGLRQMDLKDGLNLMKTR